MIDPKKLLEKLSRFESEKPFRFLGRRVVQAMAGAATANLVLGKRTAPGRYLAVRLVEGQDEKEQWEQQFAESRTAILREIEREAAVRDVQFRSHPELELVVMTEEEASRGEAERLLSTVMEGDEVPSTLARLQEEREIILPRRVRTLFLESQPAGAQVYVDHRPMGVTPCRVEDIPEGEHVLTFSCPGFLVYENTFRVEPGRPGQKLTYRATLNPEPEMGVLEVVTFPPRARVTVGAETRESPVRWRLPAGPVDVRVELDDFEPQTVRVDLPPTPDDRPHRLQLRLKYTGPGREDVVGRLIIYKPGSYSPHQAEPVANSIGSFFREMDTSNGLEEWDISPPGTPAPPPSPPVVLKELPLRRGVLMIGREDPKAGLSPDVRLFDPENSVSRGCHAWLWVYADTSTGATFNTFLIGNNSPTGIRVDGALVMETRRLADDAEIEVGNFRMRVVKEVPEAYVEVDIG
jgi:PEGA domain-containing protein